MTDPLSIFSATATVISICGIVLRYANAIRTADADFQSLKNQTQGLAEVLDYLHVNFKRLPIRQHINATHDSDEGDWPERTYWKSVKVTIDDCRETLQKLEIVLRRCASGGILGRAFRGLRLEMQNDDINQYLQQINFYRNTINFACQWLNLYFPFHDRYITD